MKSTKVKKVICFFLLMLAGQAQFAWSQVKDSLDIKIGQMILIGFAGREVDAKVLEEIRSGKVGSIIIFEKNIPLQNSYVGLKRIIWTYQQAAPIPLFISIDQEGGRVNRLKEKYTFPRSVSAANLGKYALDSVRFYSEATAATLAGLNINVNFSPVVDLASNPDNPIIAKVERSFSADPDSVAMFAREVMASHRKLGVISVLKHFPGHGSSKDDTHLGVADVTNTWNEAELRPYQILINEGAVDAVMTAHIVNKKLDATGTPGTLSKPIVDGVLRGQLRFRGVVFSDDMQMHAIAKNYGLEEAIRMAILAGVDVLTFSNNIQGSQDRTVDKVHQIIRTFVEQGVISRERIDQSYRRIMALKTKITISDAERLLQAQKQIAQLKSEIQLQQEKLQQATRQSNQPESNKKKKKKRN